MKAEFKARVAFKSWDMEEDLSCLTLPDATVTIDCDSGIIVTTHSEHGNVTASNHSGGVGKTTVEHDSSFPPPHMLNHQVVIPFKHVQIHGKGSGDSGVSSSRGGNTGLPWLYCQVQEGAVTLIDPAHALSRSHQQGASSEGGPECGRGQGDGCTQRGSPLAPRLVVSEVEFCPTAGSSTCWGESGSTAPTTTPGSNDNAENQHVGSASQHQPAAAAGGGGGGSSSAFQRPMTVDLLFELFNEGVSNSCAMGSSTDGQFGGGSVMEGFEGGANRLGFGSGFGMGNVGDGMTMLGGEDDEDGGYDDQPRIVMPKTKDEQRGKRTRGTEDE